MKGGARRYSLYIAVVLLDTFSFAVRPHQERSPEGDGGHTDSSVSPDTKDGATLVAGREEERVHRVDRFNDEFAHLHVHPSTHRMSLRKDEGQVPSLMVTFAIRAPAEVIQVTLPVGYQVVPVPGLQSSCGVWAPHKAEHASVYSRETGAKAVTEHVMSCEVINWNSSFPTKVILKLCDGIPGLSVPPEPSASGPVLHWWYFHLQAWNPDESPAPEENLFELHWAPHDGHGWTGSTIFEGWPVLGDWDCVYSDWEGWGSCSTRCGGGKERHTRRVLMRPPPDGTGSQCDQEVEMYKDCNMHPCSFPCEFVDEVVGTCTAECGGGVQPVRRRWRGDDCPEADDIDALRLETCNTQPCRNPCVLDSQWTVATDCSELCGEGHFWMFRKVVEQELNDTTCRPDWRRLTCKRLTCTPLTVMRPDRNIMPEARDTYTAGVFFKPEVNVRKLQLTAPDGFRFGPPGSVCELKGTDTLEAHDMIPYYKSCKVGARPNQVVLSFNSPVPPWEGGNLWYHFMIDVINPSCASEDWVADGYFQTLRCELTPDRNRWDIELAEEGTSAWEMLSSEGYAIYAPPEASRGTTKAQANTDMTAALEKRAEEKENKKSESAIDQSARGGGYGVRTKRWKSRPTFCSARFPCPDNSQCLEGGICPFPKF